MNQARALRWMRVFLACAIVWFAHPSAGGCALVPGPAVVMVDAPRAIRGDPRDAIVTAQRATRTSPPRPRSLAPTGRDDLAAHEPAGTLGSFVLIEDRYLAHQSILC